MSNNETILNPQIVAAARAGIRKSAQYVRDRAIAEFLHGNDMESASLLRDLAKEMEQRVNVSAADITGADEE
jgi:hypothetical protein